MENASEEQNRMKSLRVVVSGAGGLIGYSLSGLLVCVFLTDNL